MKPTFPYFYDQQFKRYILQSMAVFSSLYIKHSDGEMQQLKVRYQDGDRVGEYALAGHNQNSLLSLPIGTCKIKDVTLALNRAKGTNTVRTTIIAPPGTLPHEVQFTEQVQPKPYDLTFELKVQTSNLNQMFQIMEQICSLFDPVIQIQTSNSNNDPTAIYTMKLQNIIDEGTDGSVDRTVYIKSFTFLIEGYFYTPIEIKNNIILTIQTNLNLVQKIFGAYDFGNLTFEDLIASVNVSEKPCD